MKICTSATVFQDALGVRLSVTYSEIDDQGKVISDNKRANRILTNAGQKAVAQQLLTIAQEFVDGLEE